MNMSQAKSLFLVSLILFLSPLNAMSGYNCFDIFTNFWARTRGESTITSPTQRYGGLASLPTLESQNAQPADTLFEYQLAPTNVLQDQAAQSLEEFSSEAQQEHTSNHSLSETISGEEVFEIGQSLLERLPFDIAAKVIMPLLSVNDLKRVAYVSQKCRDQAQAAIIHLSISPSDMTKEKLEIMQRRFPSVKSFTIKGYSKVTAEGIRLLTQNFPLIESLQVDIYEGRMGAEGIEALSQPDMFKHIKELNLRGNCISNKEIELLIKAPFISQLESLDLSSNWINTEAVKILSESKEFRSLKRLNLAGNWVGDKEIEMLIKAPFASQIESLNLANNLKCYERFCGITAVGMRALSQPNVFPSLKKLYLSGNYYISHEGVKALTQASFAQQLEVLYLSKTSLDPAQIQQLSKPGIFTSLKELYLSGYSNFALSGHNKVGSLGVEALVSAPFANQLEVLDLNGSEITTKEVKMLAQPNTFTSLKVLSLRDNKNIDDEAISALINAPFAGKLEILDLNFTDITHAAWEKLKALNIAKKYYR